MGNTSLIYGKPGNGKNEEFEAKVSVLNDIKKINTLIDKKNSREGFPIHCAKLAEIATIIRKTPEVLNQVVVEKGRPQSLSETGYGPNGFYHGKSMLFKILHSEPTSSVLFKDPFLTGPMAKIDTKEREDAYEYVSNLFSDALLSALESGKVDKDVMLDVFKDGEAIHRFDALSNDISNPRESIFAWMCKKHFGDMMSEPIYDESRKKEFTPIDAAIRGKALSNWKFLITEHEGAPDIETKLRKMSEYPAPGLLSKIGELLQKEHVDKWEKVKNIWEELLWNAAKAEENATESRWYGEKIMLPWEKEVERREREMKAAEKAAAEAAAEAVKQREIGMKNPAYQLLSTGSIETTAEDSFKKYLRIRAGRAESEETRTPDIE